MHKVMRSESANAETERLTVADAVSIEKLKGVVDNNKSK